MPLGLLTDQGSSLPSTGGLTPGGQTVEPTPQGGAAGEGPTIANRNRCDGDISALQNCHVQPCVAQPRFQIGSL